MKKKRQHLYAWAIAASMLAGGMSACSDSDNPTPEPLPPVPVNPTDSVVNTENAGVIPDMAQLQIPDFKRYSTAIELSDEQKDLSYEFADFSVELFKDTYEMNKHSIRPYANNVTSPFSVIYAMSMVANGAEGQTLQEILATMSSGKYSSADYNKYFEKLTPELYSADETFKFNIANSIWINKNSLILPSYLTSLRQGYFAYWEQLDFSNKEATLQRINSWAEKETDGMINRVISDCDPTTEIILANALAIDADWEKQFDKDNTYKGQFKTEGSATVDCEFMKQSSDYEILYTSKKDKYSKIYSSLGRNASYEMAFILPDEGVNMDDFVKNLTADVILDTKNCEATKCQLNLEIPKFTTEVKEYDLKDVLKGMGMPTMMTSNAQFSRMSLNPFCVDKVDHFATISLNESGVRAAAVTVVAMAGSLGPGGPVYPKIDFKVDRPFVFAIINNQTNNILFMGVIKDPSLK